MFAQGHAASQEPEAAPSSPFPGTWSSCRGRAERDREEEASQIFSLCDGPKLGVHDFIDGNTQTFSQ